MAVAPKYLSARPELETAKTLDVSPQRRVALQQLLRLGSVRELVVVLHSRTNCGSGLVLHPAHIRLHYLCKHGERPNMHVTEHASDVREHASDVIV